MKKTGKHSTLSDAREKALEDLGFVFESHYTRWEERLEELREFEAKHGHCNVPKAYSPNRPLGVCKYDFILVSLTYDSNISPCSFRTVTTFLYYRGEMSKAAV